MGDEGITVNLEPDGKSVEKWRKQLADMATPKQFNTSLKNAINRAMDAAKTQGKREITQRYTIKQKDVAENTKPKRATANNLSAILQYIGSNIAATKFKIKPPEPLPAKHPIVNIQYKKDGGGPRPEAFVAQMPSGHIGVFERLPGQFSKKHKSGQGPLTYQKIQQLMGPSVVGMVGGKDAKEAIQNRANEVLSERIDHEMKRLMEKLSAPK